MNRSRSIKHPKRLLKLFVFNLVFYFLTSLKAYRNDSFKGSSQPRSRYLYLDDDLFSPIFPFPLILGLARVNTP